MTGSIRNSASITLAEWVRIWRPTTAALKPKTKANYESLLRKHILPEFGDVPLSRIQPSMVRGWVAELISGGLSASRIRQNYFLLGSILGTAVLDNRISRNPCLGVKLPPMQREDMQIISEEQIDTLAKRCRPHDALAYLLAYGGLRWGEMAALRVERVDTLRSRVFVCESLADVDGHLHFGPTKTYAKRWVRLPKWVVEMLPLIDKARGDLVFTAPEGGPLRYSNFRKRVWLKALGGIVPLTFTPTSSATRAPRC